MKLDFIKQGWSRLKRWQKIVSICGVVLILALLWVSFVPAKYGGSEILPPSGGANLTAITTNVLPNITNNYNIGSPAKSWKNIYASGTSYLVKISSSNVSSTLGTITTLWDTKLIPTNVSSTNLNFVTEWGTKSTITNVSSTALNFTTAWGTKITPTYVSSTGLNWTTAWGSKSTITNVSSTLQTLTTGWFTNLIGSTVTTTKLGLNAGGQISVGGVNPTRTIILSGAGAWSPTTGGNLGTYQTEMATNKQNFQYVQFSSSTIQGTSWTVVMPESYKGGTITAMYYQTATSTCAGNVIWATRAVAYNNASALDAAWGTAVSTTVALQGTANYISTSTESGAITIAGSPRGGSLVQFGIRHDGLSASETAGCNVDLVMVKIRYPIGSYSD